jgi:hypothetical protein
LKELEDQLDAAVIAKEVTIDLILAVVLWAEMVATKTENILFQMLTFTFLKQTHDIFLNLLVDCR